MGDVNSSNSEDFIKGGLLGKGKTKRIHEIQGNSEYVIMENTDDVTAGDGEKHDISEGKAKASTTITSKIFEYLELEGISTHFEKQLNDTEMLVQKCDMIPLECVFRHMSTGSYRKRDVFQNGEKALPDGTVLHEPLMEFFYKNDVVLENGDVISDPLMDVDEEGILKIEDGKFVLLHPNTGEELNYKSVVNPSTKEVLTNEQIEEDKERILRYAGEILLQTTNVGQKLKELYQKEGLELFDGKIEFGINSKGELVVADVIDGDSCRLRRPILIEGTDGKQYLGKRVTQTNLKQHLSEVYISPMKDLLNFISHLPLENRDTEIRGIIQKEFQKNEKVFREKFPDIRETLNTNEVPIFSELRGFTRKLLQDIMRKKVGELEGKHLGEEFFGKNEDGLVVLKSRMTIDNIQAFWEMKFDKISEIPKNMETQRILEGEGLDKQGYRDGGSAGDTVGVYQKLAIILTELLENLSIEKTREVVASRIGSSFSD